MQLPPTEQLLASAVRYLIDGQERDAASVLVACSMSIDGVVQHLGGSITVKISLRGPRAIYEMASAVESYRPDPFWSSPEDAADFEAKRKTLDQIRSAIEAVMPSTVAEAIVTFRAHLIELDEDWQRELEEIARGKAVHNQAAEGERILIWNNHRFRSNAEIRMAQALEQAKVLFFPNCKVRLGISKRQNREPDFLICHKGKWGILEVDGELFHPVARTAEDHERDRLFLAHGIKLVQHFDAGECFENAEGIVKKFLYLLEQQ